MAGTRREYWLLAALYQMCRMTGVLPVVRNTHISQVLHLCGSGKDCFSWSIWGLLATILHLVVNSVFAFTSPPSLAQGSTSELCIWIQNQFSSLTVLLLILLRQPKTLIECLSTACKIYTIPSKNAKTLNMLLFSILMVSPFFTIIYLLFSIPVLPMESIFLILQSNYKYIPEAAVEVVISTLCFIAERAHNDINNQLKQIQKLKFQTKTYTSFKQLLENHIAVSKFVRCFAAYFSPHFLISFLSFISRMIIYTIICIKLVKTKAYLTFFAFAVHAFYSLFRLFLVCHCCQNVKEEEGETMVIIRRIRILWVDKISEEQAMLLDTYEELMESTSVEFNACGLFPVNMQQVLSVIGLIITYGLVALQTK